MVYSYLAVSGYYFNTRKSANKPRYLVRLPAGLSMWCQPSKSPIKLLLPKAYHIILPIPYATLSYNLSTAIPITANLAKPQQGHSVLLEVQSYCACMLLWETISGSNAFQLCLLSHQHASQLCPLSHIFRVSSLFDTLSVSCLNPQVACLNPQRHFVYKKVTLHIFYANSSYRRLVFLFLHISQQRTIWEPQSPRTPRPFDSELKRSKDAVESCSLDLFIDAD